MSVRHKSWYPVPSTVALSARFLEQCPSRGAQKATTRLGKPHVHLAGREPLILSYFPAYQTVSFQVARRRHSALISKGFQRSKTYRVLRISSAIAVIGVAFYYLGANLIKGASEVDLRTLRFRWPFILLCGLMIELDAFLGAWAYDLVLKGIGYDIGFRRSARVHLFANLAKYIPGYVWQGVSKVYLSHKENVPARKAGFVVVLEMGMLMCAGLLVGDVSFSLQSSWVLDFQHRVTYQIIGALLPALALVLLPEAIHRAGILVNSKGKAEWEFDVSRGALWSAAGVMVLAWLIWGLALFALASAFQPLATEDVLICVFSTVSSVLLGLAIPFVPGGIVVRESAMAYLLAPVMPASVASLVAITMRLIIIVCEALGVLFTWLVLRRGRHNDF